jgi:hypothetical protein
LWHKISHREVTGKPFPDPYCCNQVESQEFQISKVILVERLFIEVGMDKSQST